MIEIRELTFLSMSLRMILSIVIGGALGFERGQKNRPAGLRTYMLVCLGACIIMVTNQYVYQAYGVGDPMRMGAQVVSGIGFLGAGTIIVTVRNQIRGLTTAAGLWATAGVGLAIGIGLYEAALVGGGAIALVLAVLQKWDFAMRKTARMIEVYIELKKGEKLVSFVYALKNRGIELSNLYQENGTIQDNDAIAFIGTLSVKEKCNHNDLLLSIRSFPQVEYAEEL